MIFDPETMSTNSFSKTKDWPLRLTIALFAGVTIALVFSPLSRLLLYLFPLMAFVVAGIAFIRSKLVYASLVCWLWILTPLVRRIVDYQSGWIPATAVLLAPVLATCIPTAALIGGWRSMVDRRLSSLFCVLAGIIYGTVIGVAVHNSRKLMAVALLSWFAPLCFSFFVYQQKAIARELHAVVQKAFLIGLILTGSYGIYQFFYLPKWDAFWMQNITLVSIGVAEPLQFRIFSTMNSPQIFGAYVVVALLFAFRSTSRFRFLAIPVGLIALALTGARSAWVGFGIGVLALFFFLPHRQKIQLVMVGSLSVIVLLGLLQVPGVNDALIERFRSLSDPSHDASLNVRTHGYQLFMQGMMENPFGQGLGFSEDDPDGQTAKGSQAGKARGLGQGDSAIIGVFVSFGVFGAFAYLYGLGVPIMNVLKAPKQEGTDLLALKAILIALTAESLVSGVLFGPGGFLTWSALGLGITLTLSAREEPERTPMDLLDDPFGEAPALLN